jgi:NADH-quinone oxidoreductase subunit M
MLIVSHLGVVLVAGSASTPAASEGALVHLLVVALWSGAWVLVVGMLGQRRHTTHLTEFGGLWRVMPGLSTVFVLTVLAALAVPGTAAYVGISRVLDGIASESSLIDGHLFGGLVAAGVAVWSICLLRIVHRVVGGSVTRDRNRGLRDLNVGEWMVVAPLVIVTLVAGVWPSPLLALVQAVAPESWLSAMLLSGGGQ